MNLFDENSDGELSYTEFKQVGDLDVINTVTQALERLGGGGGGGMSGGGVAAIVIVSLLLVGGSVAGYFVYKKKDIIRWRQFSYARQMPANTEGIVNETYGSGGGSAEEPNESQS